MGDPVEYYLTLEVTCLNPPSRPGVFGLQDKKGQLYAPVQESSNAQIFRCPVQVKRATESGAPNFLGAFAHGSPGDRFLYLSLRPARGPDGAWIRRIKVPLKPITWEQVEDASSRPEARLACTVDGTGSGTVKQIGGWQIA